MNSLGVVPQTPEIAVVTDSTADIPTEYRERYGIHVIPNLIIIDGKSLQDEVDISRQEFYEYLASSKTLPTTATASSGAYQEIYAELFEQGFQHILSIHPPGHLSGIFNAAWIASQDFAGRVTVIDSQQLTLGQGFQVIAAAEAVQQGRSLGEVIDEINAVRERVRLYAMLDTLEYVRRSGRVSWTKARLGELLRVKPFVEVRDGQVMSLGETRTTRKGHLRLRELLLNLGPIEKLAILHSNSEQQAIQFINDLPETLPLDPIIVNITSIIGTHVGPNGIGFVTVLR